MRGPTVENGYGWGDYGRKVKVKTSKIAIGKNEDGSTIWRIDILSVHIVYRAEETAQPKPPANPPTQSAKKPLTKSQRERRRRKEARRRARKRAALVSNVST